METNFDVHAKNYNDIFTYSLIGKAQRSRVFHFLNKQNTLENKLHILELNCGTGFDANSFSNMGHTVLATDISSEMIKVAKQNYKNPTIEFKQLDIRSITSTTFLDKFDFIFSNFGGLNCLSPKELKDFLSISDSLLKPNGNMALVLMPKNCLWERFYFLLKGEFKKIARRNTNQPILANVEGVQIPTWYFNPKDIISNASEKFKIVSLNPIGIAIPPSYLEPFFKNKKIFFKLLARKEKWLANKFWAKYADHYLIVFQKK
tara:strand:+ start:41351 stop:42133 length:783 start_codon:yes stop_codon:yes gene_type:complete